MSDGKKYDDGKLRMSLLSSEWLRQVSAVLTFGAEKYAAHNWRRGLPASRLVDAAMRHLTAWNEGEDTDPESGLSHLAHASCCLMFLSELFVDPSVRDDRYKVAKSARFQSYWAKGDDKNERQEQKHDGKNDGVADGKEQANPDTGKKTVNIRWNCNCGDPACKNSCLF